MTNPDLLILRALLAAFTAFALTAWGFMDNAAWFLPCGCASLTAIVWSYQK